MGKHDIPIDYCHKYLNAPRKILGAILALLLLIYGTLRHDVDNENDVLFSE